MADKSEIEIINEKVAALIKHQHEQSVKTERILENLKVNQGRFYHWQNLEKQMDTILYKNEDAIFAYLQKNLGEGMLTAVLKRFIPDIKKDLSRTIDGQIDLLNPLKDNKK